MSKLLPKKKFLLVVMPDYIYICFAFAQHVQQTHTSSTVSKFRFCAHLKYYYCVCVYVCCLHYSLLCRFSVLNKNYLCILFEFSEKQDFHSFFVYTKNLWCSTQIIHEWNKWEFFRNTENIVMWHFLKWLVSDQQQQLKLPVVLFPFYGINIKSVI